MVLVQATDIVVANHVAMVLFDSLRQLLVLDGDSFLRLRLLQYVVGDVDGRAGASLLDRLEALLAKILSLHVG